MPVLSLSKLPANSRNHRIAGMARSYRSGPAHNQSLFRRTDRGEYALQYRGGRGRATTHHHVHRNHIGDLAASGVVLARAVGALWTKDAAITGAIAYRHYQLGFRRGIKGALERGHHVTRHRACDQQHVRMARAGDEFDAQSFDVVISIVDRVYLQFATVA